MNINDIKCEAFEKGFVHIRSFLSSDLISKSLEDLQKKSDREKLSDFFSNRDFDYLIFDPKILKIANALTNNNIYYYGETNYSYVNEPFSSWHCDARGSIDNLESFYEIDSDEIYSGWRFAFYLDDYSNYSGGLKVSPYSHKHPLHYQFNQDNYVFDKVGNNYSFKPTGFELYNIPSKPGDLIIFNLRLFHSGGFLKFKDGSNYLPEIEQFIKKHRIKEFSPYGHKKTRSALMFDFGSPSLGLDLYIKWRANRLLNHEKSVFYSNSKGSDSIYTYYSKNHLKVANDYSVKLRFDRCIAEILFKGPQKISSEDKMNLDWLIENNSEFSNYHSILKNISN
jgi:hypothetical protein